MFSKKASKKTSESGVWVEDSDAPKCSLCQSLFSLLNRRHHCRSCGNVVCGKCSKNRQPLASSRTGALKRVCDKCVDGNPGGQEVSDDGQDDDDVVVHTQMAPPPSAASHRSSVRMPTPSSGQGYGAALTSAAPASTPIGRTVSAEDSTPPASAVVESEAVRALKMHSFDGRWSAILVFHEVDIGKGDDVAIQAAEAYRSAPRSKSTVLEDGIVRRGSKLLVHFDLEPKGASYFKGTSGELAQFGREGVLTGSLQRATGRVTMTLQAVNPLSKVTTSFTFTGTMNLAGLYTGSFNACEISRMAGQAQGTFKMARILDDSGDEGKAAAPAPPPKRKESTDTESDDDEDEGTGVRVKLTAQSSASDDDSD